MKVLIVGYGSIGKRHFSILSKFKDISLCDIVTKQKLKNRRTFQNLKDVKLEKYDYIIIASKTSLHYEQLRYIEKNVSNKIILVEKPLFHEHRKLKIKNNKVFVAYNRRFYSIIKKIKKLINKENILLVHIYTGQFLPFWREDRKYQDTYSAKKAEGGGVLLDLSHEIDYIYYLLGRFDIIFSINSKVSNLEIDTDDICMCLAKTKNKTLINFTIDYISKEFKQVIILHTNNFSLFADLKNMSLTQVFKNKNKKVFKFSKFDKDNSFKKMHKDILSKNKTILCSYEDALYTMENINLIWEKNHEK